MQKKKKNKKYEKLGCLNFFDFLPALAAFLCLTVLPGTCREHEKILTLQEKHQNFLVRYLAGDLPGILFLPTCRDLPDR